ncbi:MAG: pyridoxal phosphate-dependent aminotransferase [Alphaproteobacteria bacterium]|nr:pyridoxal phosphate-dependent aminotransferase [Alphaproteobacteria bacterium]
MPDNARSALQEPPVRRQVHDIPSSLIRDVANYGMGLRHDGAEITPLWFGESDLATPGFIRDAAKASLEEGETFYSQNLGIPPLRAALAKYLTELYGVAIAEQRVSVTSSGMSAIMLIMETLIDPGDNVVIAGPVWPNCRDAVNIMGGETRFANVALEDDRWQLDLDRMFALVDDRTRAIFVNSPNNPTGWMMTVEEQRAVLDFCRARGLWVIADEVYDRIVYDRPHAPTFLQIAEPDDAVIAINSFSKSWCMTGWRLGWLVGPPRLSQEFGKIIEFNWSCAPVFVQRAGVAALQGGEEFVAWARDYYRQGRDLVHQRLAGNARVRIARPEAAFYAFFGVEGMTDSVAFAKQLIDRGGVGLAPGAAFAGGGEGFLRLCFASAPETLSAALDRLEEALG